jgi:hypothetical protein
VSKINWRLISKVPRLYDRIIRDETRTQQELTHHRANLIFLIIILGKIFFLNLAFFSHDSLSVATYKVVTPIS